MITPHHLIATYLLRATHTETLKPNKLKQLPVFEFRFEFEFELSVVEIKLTKQAKIYLTENYYYPVFSVC